MDKEQAKKIQEECIKRFRKYSNPCKTCKYRSTTENPAADCIFEDCPCDWNKR